MTPDFDVIVIGSGPAGVSATFPLVEAGLKVLMVDAGRQAESIVSRQSFLTSRAQDEKQWKWMLGEKFHAMRMHEAVSPKLRVPGYSYVFEDFCRANRIRSTGFVAIGSLAPGGLSNAWGCGVARLSETELWEYPFRESDIQGSYEAVAKRIGISGRKQDDLSDYFGLDAWSQPGIPMDELHAYLEARYLMQRHSLASHGFRIGRSRVAVLSEDQDGRMACDRMGNCLWGCQRRSLYSATEDIRRLKEYSNFHYEAGVLVEHLSRDHDYWTAKGIHIRHGLQVSLKARRIFLATGTLATTRIALTLLKSDRSVRVLYCPTAAFVLWLPAKFGAERRPEFSLGQLSFVLSLQEGMSVFGSTFNTTGIPASEFVSHIPLRRRYAIDFVRSFLSSCVVGNVFLPGCYSETYAALSTDGHLKINGGVSSEVIPLMSKISTQLRKSYKKLGAYLLPSSFTTAKAGADIHYAGTLPMRQSPAVGETNMFGELFRAEDIYIVDGACLSSLSEKSHTLTIMANADRIGRHVARKTR